MEERLSAMEERVTQKARASDSITQESYMADRQRLNGIESVADTGDANSSTNGQHGISFDNETANELGVIDAMGVISFADEQNLGFFGM
jgi:hypothetical protein